MVTASTSTSKAIGRQCSLRGELFPRILTTDELLAATSDERWLEAMLDAEAALARAAAAGGVIPAAAADAIASACRGADFDLPALGREARGGGNPVITLVDVLRERTPADGRDWVHFGATSQDIIDTAMMIV